MERSARYLGHVVDERSVGPAADLRRESGDGYGSAGQGRAGGSAGRGGGVAWISLGRRDGLYRENKAIRAEVGHTFSWLDADRVVRTCNLYEKNMGFGAEMQQNSFVKMLSKRRSRLPRHASQLSAGSAGAIGGTAARRRHQVGLDQGSTPESPRPPRSPGSGTAGSLPLRWPAVEVGTEEG